MNRIICGESSKVLSELEDNFFDLTVTSPPYDNLRTYEGFEFDFNAIATQLYRVTREGGVVVWVVGDAVIKGSESGTSFRQALGFMDAGFRLHDTMIYQKSGFSNPEKVRYHQTFEYMFVFSKGKPKTFNPLKDRKNKWLKSWGKSSTRGVDGELAVKKNVGKESNEYGMRFNIWKYHNGAGFGTKDKNVYKHPASFPEALARDHILSWSNDGDVVLDPFNGSGTTGREAVLLGRNYYGIDISEEYCELSRKRIADALESL